MAVTQEMVDSAIAQAVERFPSGYAGAAALQTDDGEIITSVFFDSLNDTTHLCHEVGAICEAYRRDKKVIASVCVSRESEAEDFIILTACGVCQERLSSWGRDVSIAVPLKDDPTKWDSHTLRELQPHYWRSVFEDDHKQKTGREQGSDRKPDTAAS